MNHIDEITKAYLSIITEAAARNLDFDECTEWNIENAIKSKEVVSFNYIKKDGSKCRMTVLPVQKFMSHGRPAVWAYVNGVEDERNRRMLYIDSMGAFSSVADLPEEIWSRSLSSYSTVPTNSIFINDDFARLLKAAVDEKKMVSFYYKVESRQFRVSGMPGWHRKKACFVYNVMPTLFETDYDDDRLWWLTGYVDGIQDELHKMRFTCFDFRTQEEANEINSRDMIIK